MAWLDPAGIGATGALAFDASGDRLLSTNRDGDVRVWQVDARHLSMRQDLAAPYNDVAISDDGRRVAEVANAGIVVRDVASGEAVGFVPVVSDVDGLALDKGGHRAVFGVDRGAFVRTFDDVMSEPSSRREQVLSLDGSVMTDATWIGQDVLITVTRSGGVLRFVGDALRPAAEVRLPEGAVVVEPSPDGSALLVGGRNGLAWLLDASTLQVRRTYAVSAGDGVSGVAFSPDGARVALASSSVITVRTIGGALVRRVPGEHIVGACTGFTTDGRVVAMRGEGAVLIDVDTGETTPLWQVPPTGSCELSARGVIAMRLGDYVYPLDLTADAALWFTRGFVDGVASTQRSTTYPVGTAYDVTSIAQGPAHFCLTETGGRFTMVAGQDHRVVARVVDAEVWPAVVASNDGCVWQHDTELRRLRPGGDGGDGGDSAVDVIAREVTGFGGGQGVIIAHSDGSVRVVLDDAKQGDQHLPLGTFTADGTGVVVVDERVVALALSSGEVALWHLDRPAPPDVVRTTSGDLSVVAIGRNALVATGATGETMSVADRASGTIVVDERIRGAVQQMRFVNDGSVVLLLVGTNLGLVHRFDVTPLVTERCALLRRIWQAAPVSWEQGRPTPAPPPRDHECFRGDVPRGG